MEKSYNYNFTTNAYYNEEIDEHEEESQDYKYIVDDEERLISGVAWAIYRKYFYEKCELSDCASFCGDVQKCLRKFIKEYDLLEEIVDCFEDELNMYFYDDAEEEFRRDIE